MGISIGSQADMRFMNPADVSPIARDYTKTNLSYQEALIMAMNKEKEKFILYQELADCTNDTKCKQTFLSLANQEARQKLKLEIEYDEFILYDN